MWRVIVSVSLSLSLIGFGGTARGTCCHRRTPVRAAICAVARSAGRIAAAPCRLRDHRRHTCGGSSYSMEHHHSVQGSCDSCHSYH